MKIISVTTARGHSYTVERDHSYNWPVKVTEIRELDRPYPCYRLVLENGYTVLVLDAVEVEERPE